MTACGETYPLTDPCATPPTSAEGPGSRQAVVPAAWFSAAMVGCEPVTGTSQR
jgi:hypothetical protein